MTPQFGKRLSLTFSAVILLVVVSHGVSAAPVDEADSFTSIQTVNDPSLFLINRWNPTAMFSCIKNYWKDLTGHVMNGTQIVSLILKKVAEFLPKLRNCSFVTSSAVEIIQCQIGVAIQAIQDAVNIHNQVLTILSNAKGTLRDISKCTWEGGPTAEPQSVPQKPAANFYNLLM